MDKLKARSTYVIQCEASWGAVVERLSICTGEECLASVQIHSGLHLNMPVH